MASQQHYSDLTSTAAPFVPSSLQGSTIENDSPQKLVQVTRGGCIFFVPESEAGPTPTTDTAAADADWFLAENGSSPMALNPRSVPAPNRFTLGSLLSHEKIRQAFDAQNEWLLRQLDPSDERYKEIPAGFHCMYPLDPPVAKNSHRDAAGSWGYPTHTYKVTSHADGRTYALRRIENVRTTNEIANSAVHLWSRVVHPGVLPLHKAFVSHGALFFLYDYIPGAQSLKTRYIDVRATTSVQQEDRSTRGCSPARHFASPGQRSRSSSPGIAIRSASPLAERILWTYICQLVSAVYTIHMAGMACRSLDIAHVLLCDQGRIRINGVGIIDVLEYDTQKSVAELQREDLFSLGRLILSLANRCVVTNASVPLSLEGLRQHYSPEMNSFVTVLISNTHSVSIRDIVTMISSHLMDALQHQYG